MWSQLLEEHLELQWGVCWKQLSGKVVLWGRYNPSTAPCSCGERAATGGHAEVWADGCVGWAWSKYHCFAGFGARELDIGMAVKEAVIRGLQAWQYRPSLRLRSKREHNLGHAAWRPEAKKDGRLPESICGAQRPFERRWYDQKGYESVEERRWARVTKSIC